MASAASQVEMWSRRSIREEDVEGLIDELPQFAVVGLNAQVLNVQLSPSHVLVTEPGVLLHVAPEIEVSTRCYWSLSRFMSGESQTVTIFRNGSDSEAIVGITPSRPSKVLPIEIPSGEQLHCRRGSWLATLGEGRVSSQRDCRFLTCVFGGQGWRHQTVSST